MAEFFWLIVVPLGACAAWGAFVSRAAQLDQPVAALPAWQRGVRAMLAPGYDDTQAQAVARSQRAELELASLQARNLRSAIGVSSQIGRG